MRGSNPALNDTFEDVFHDDGVYNDIMTLEGTVSKSMFLVVLLVAAAVGSWRFASMPSYAAHMQSVLIGCLILAFITAMITIFKKSMSPTTAPAYALLEGAALGIISHQYESVYSGIVLQAIFLTVSVFFALLLCYKSGLIQVTQNFRLAVVSATIGIFFVYIISFLGQFIGFSVPYLHESGPLGIGISLVIVGVAALNLVLDFDFIESGSESGRLPGYMEWYGAFGLLITLVWLYIEILRLLAKLRDE